MSIRRPLQFGVGDGYSYVFPQTITSYRDNFSDVQPVTSRVIGASGGVDEFGRGVKTTANGNVSITWWFVGDTQDEVEAERDAIKGMVSLGTQPLIFQHGTEVRWCWAYLNAPDLTINATSAPDNKQRVTANFRVDNPQWYGISSSLYGGTPAVLWSGTATSGAGTFGSHQKYYGTVVDGGTVTVVNNGQHYAPAMLAWNNVGTAGTVDSPRIYYKDRSGIVVDDLTYDAEIVDGQGVRIDARDYSTVPAAALDNLVYATPGWLMIPPGTVDLRVGIAAGTAILKLDFEDRWY
jgi:hypothetical protein